MLYVMLPKVDYVLITSLFVCIKIIVVREFSLRRKSYEVIVRNGTVWQQTVPFCFMELRKEECVCHKLVLIISPSDMRGVLILFLRMFLFLLIQIGSLGLLVEMGKERLLF